MKLLHAIASVDPTGGGPIEGVRLRCLALQNLGHTVEIASLDAPEASFLADFPAPVYALGPGKTKYSYSPRLLPWLRANAPRYDAVIVNGIWQYNGFATWRALRNSSTPYFVFTHGMLDPWFKRTYPLKHLKKWLYWPWADYRVLRDAAAVFFTCEEERRLARQSFWLYLANEKVVNYGAAAPQGNADNQREIFFLKYPNLRAKRIVLFLGRIHEKKGCDLALKAFAATLAHDPSCHLVMAGPDQTGWQSSLVALAASLGISDKVTWTGMITGDLKLGALHAADVFFLPSHQENFGIVVAESLACGVPVLISNKVNIWREIEQDGAGLAAEDDLAGSCNLLQSWADLSQPQKHAMRNAALNCFKSRFEINHASSTLLDILQQVIDQKNPPNSRAASQTVGAAS